MGGIRSPWDTVRAAIVAEQRGRERDRARLADGWVDGWKSICGAEAAIPPPPDIVLPSGADPYNYRREQGRARD
jgi:hypothetical protein